MERNFLKRLNYKKQDIKTQSFNRLILTGVENVSNIEYMPIDEFINNTPQKELDKIFDYSKNYREKNCGLGDNFIQEVKDKRNSGFYLKIKKSKGETANIIVNFNMNAENSVLYDQNFIHVEEGANAKIFLYYDVETKNKLADGFLYRNGLLTVFAEKNAIVDFIKVQNLSASSINFDTTNFHVMEESAVKLYDIQLGAKVNGCSTTTYMPQSNAVSKIYPLYFADKDRKFDLEQNYIIDGKESNGHIFASGALKNQAYKMFRGNIFLNKGCRRSVAKFSDNTIMLDKTTKAASIPTIFCDEDDVIGEHAASFEAVNRDKLYYLMTRGFDELSAKKLIIEAAFKPVFNMIDDEIVRNRLLNEFSASLDEIYE